MNNFVFVFFFLCCYLNRKWVNQQVTCPSFWSYRSCTLRWFCARWGRALRGRERATLWATLRNSSALSTLIRKTLRPLRPSAATGKWPTTYRWWRAPRLTSASWCPYCGSAASATADLSSPMPWPWPAEVPATSLSSINVQDQVN